MNNRRETALPLPGWEAWAITGVMLAMIIIIALA